MTEMDDRVDQWLRDAHAMEEQAEQMLTAEASRIENYPELRARIQQHIEETRSQRDRIRGCLERRGSSTSGMKDLAGKFTAIMQGVSGTVAGDEVVKGSLASYTFEHMEIASYRILSAAAKAAQDPETARVCDEICHEEEAMAAWIADHLADTTRTYLTREASSSDTAKR